MNNIYFTAKLWATLSPRITKDTVHEVKTRKPAKPTRAGKAILKDISTKAG